jgi:hypothetical protein
MILLTIAAALAACDPAAMLPALVAHGDRDAYHCVTTAEAGRDLLITHLDAAPAGGTERLTRALALWLLEHTDRVMDPAVVARLSPADRRLLADGIRARRGRASPSAEHAAIFAQLSWYAPDRTYTDGRLRALDRENLLVVDPPRPPPPPPPPADTDAAENVVEPGPDGVVHGGSGAATLEEPPMCACGVVGPGAALLGIGIAIGAVGARRR